MAYHQNLSDNLNSFAAQYYAAQPSEKESDVQARAQRVLEPLLKDFAADWEERVRRAFRQWNNILRDYLRNETALRLTVGDSHTAVPVRITDGLPAPFAEIVNDFNDPIIWRLYLNRSLIAPSINGLRLVEDIAITMPVGEWPFDEITRKDISPVRQLFENLEAYLQELELFKRLATLESDTLGAYFFRVPEIHLYWKVIGITAGILNVPIEALTIVTLTHELAHAYTHLGKDIDGVEWNTEAFAQTDLEIVEGLAQFYTAVICDKMKSRLPEVGQAFKALLKMQPTPYTVHQEWAKGESNRGEIVRFAMINTRLKSTKTYEEWQKTLAKFGEAPSKAQTENTKPNP